MHGASDLSLSKDGKDGGFEFFEDFSYEGIELDAQMPNRRRSGRTVRT